MHSMTAFLIIPKCFNPHPARGPGDAINEVGVNGVTHVSIRTRPEGRVMPRPIFEPLSASKFQSAPGPRAG